MLVPAALENAITAANAHTIHARIVAEAANGPVTPEADRIFDQKGVFLIPDILCNAGGVTVSYFEWVQDENHLFWDENDVNMRAGEDHEAVVQRRAEDPRRPQGEHARWRRTCWASAASPKPARSAACIRRTREASAPAGDGTPFPRLRSRPTVPPAPGPSLPAPDRVFK